ncbi:MAG: hypothetical protein RDU76_11535 [Candidatus Edwardsbacteria bacterium]|nr:hypothetical protein [Candidatus Edwardsbacteria bacterium]
MQTPAMEFFQAYQARSRKNILAILAASIILLVLAVLPLWAQQSPTAVPPLNESLAGFFQRFVAPILTAFLMGMVSILIGYLSKKFKTDALYQNRELINKIVLGGISYAEEQAYKAIKNNKKIDGQNKMILAVSFILEQMPSLSADQAERLVESLLAQIKGVGASKDLAVGQ